MCRSACFGEHARACVPQFVYDALSLLCMLACSVCARCVPGVCLVSPARPEALLLCMVEPVGFSDGRPVLACVLFKSLLHWRSLEAERTNVFDRIVQTILGAVEQDSGVGNLAYWLSNTVHLLCLLERSIKPSSGTPAAAATPTPGDACGYPQLRAHGEAPCRPLLCQRCSPVGRR